MDDVSKQPISWMKGAFYLSFAALIVKGLSALYKVPYQNLTGDIGYYVYQQVYPLYGVVFVLGTYGFPMVISRILAEKENEDSLSIQKNRIIIIFIALFLFNGIIGSGIIFYSKNIALFMGDENLKTALRWLGIPFFIIPFLSVSRGYFQSKGNMVPTSISQVLEQIVRVAVILLVAYWAMKQGTPYIAGISAGLGAFTGGLIGIITMYYYWRKESPFEQNKHRKRGFVFPPSWKNDVKSLLVTGFFVSISAMALTIFQLLDSFSVLRLLVQGGWDTEGAAILKGIHDRGWPMIQFGAVVTTVFSYASIPFISKAYARNQKEQVEKLIQQAVKICLVFGGAASLGLITIMSHLNPMLFIDSLGTDTLRLLSSTVFTGALFMTAAALLHAIGKAGKAACLLLIGIFIKGLGNVLTVPHLGVQGAALSTSTAFFIISIIALLVLKKLTFFSFYKRTFWIKWCVSLTGMMLTVLFLQRGAVFLANIYVDGMGRLFHSVIATGGAIIGGIVFLLLIWSISLFDKKEWEELPKLSKVLPYRGKG